MSEIPLLTFEPQPDAVVVDLDQLMTSRLLIQANSGGGKSWALRYLLEQTHGRVQQIVIDPEGEYASLRERFPFVLAGREGDIAADPTTAAALCHRLMELQTSAVIDLYDLHLDERRRFVKVFLDTLIHLPRDLWHPLLVVLDEAHRFAPERGDVESSQAVIALCSEGRKRPFCAVLATQRLSKLHKDAAAELANRMIGRTGLDVDMRRAGDDLGFDKDARTTLKTLTPGTFYTYGPAISNEVVLVRTGAVQTTHPGPGAIIPPAPPTPEAIRDLLGQLADLPSHAATEASRLTAAQRRIADLEEQLRLAGDVIAVRPITEQTTAVGDDQIKQLRATIRQLDTIARDLTAAIDRVAPQSPPASPTQLKSGTRARPPARSSARSKAARTKTSQPKATAQRTAATKRRTSTRPAATGAPDEIAKTIAIPAIAAKVAQARNMLDDTSARGYVPRILRLLWQNALRPEDLAEGRGTASTRTVTRLRSACRALQQVKLLADAGDGRLQVNHEEIDRLRELDRTLRGQR